MTRIKGRWRLTAVLAATVAVAVAVPAASQAQQVKPAGEHDDTQAVLDAYLPHAGPGAAVYAGNGTSDWTVTSGTAKVGENRPITPTEHFFAASQTKTFTAALVLQLVDEGLVDLDAPVEQYLPGVVAGNGHDGNTITVRQLLQHGTGISTDYGSAQPQADGTYTDAELVRAGLTTPPAFPPGTDYLYSNVNYVLAGMIAEKVTGKAPIDAITERIITPLGLADTTYPAPGDKTLDAPFLPGYIGQRIGSFFFWADRTETVEPTLMSSAGAIQSTLTDLVAFQRALADGELVSAAALTEMRETVPVPVSDEFDYGLGLMHMTLSCGGEAWGHAGDLSSGHTSITMVTDDGRFASLATNTIVTDTTAEPTRVDVMDSALCGTPAGEK